MAERKVIWTETAALQRRYILEYWLSRNQSNTYPIKLLRLSNEKANQIAADPLIYKTSEFPNTRVAAIIIMAFWDNRQDHKKLLELLKASHGKKV